MNKTQRRQSVVKRGREGGGGFIFHLAIQIPILKFSKIPFALFVGTSNLHSVQCVRNRFVKSISRRLFRRPCFTASQEVLLRSENAMCALKLPMSQVFSNVKVFFGGGRGEGLRTSCSPYTAAYETPKRTNFQAVKNNFVRCRVNVASQSVLLAWVGGWVGVGRAALFKGGGLSPERLVVGSGLSYP